MLADTTPDTMLADTTPDAIQAGTLLADENTMPADATSADATPADAMQADAMQADAMPADAMHPQVARLLLDRGIAQRTPEWLAARMRLITATDVSSVLKMTRAACEPYVKLFGLQETFVYSDSKTCNPYISYNAFLKKKAMTGPATDTMNLEFMAWGTLYEAVACKIYQQMTRETVHDFGLMICPTRPWVGASPDGVTSSGKVLEIKVPSLRQPSSIPPLWYVMQMWWQMLTLGLDEGDFFDVRIVEWSILDEWLVSANETWDESRQYHTHGIVCQNMDTSVYEYAPDDMRRPLDFVAWSRQKQQDDESMRPVYYQMITYHLVRVPLPIGWFEANEHVFLKALNDIEHARNLPAKIAAESPRKPRVIKKFCVMTQCII